ncbi:hypothetical protein IH992_10680 [Candidatus Poribacteria bacterium]|nr:hypothetical protein [Candidatus Poribacteria bacterium]
MSEALLPADVRRHLATASIGHRLYYYPETDSTNDVAIDLARNGEPEGAVVYTDFQRRGRGRLDHKWSSPRQRDLLFSVILRPESEPREALAITLAFSVAAAGQRQDIGAIATMIEIFISAESVLSPLWVRSLYP